MSKQKVSVTIRIPYKMYMFYNKLLRQCNTKRSLEGKKEMTKSAYLNYMFKCIAESIILEEGRVYLPVAQSRINKIDQLEIKDACKRTISIRLSEYNIYLLDKIIGDYNGKSRGENIRQFLYFYYIKKGA